MTSETSLADQARDRLVPLIERVLEAHDRDDDVLSQAFFTNLLMQAHAMRDDTDLAAFFFELSTTAFQGFVFTPAQAEAIDELLAESENMAFALTAPSERPH
ncbi:MAG: hypothetical protein RIC56_17745 [Pseudomonadales bacterium]